MENNQPIIEKIKKLLALANSSNEHEAALAASHAQRLLSEHNLAMADIEAAHKPDKADKVDTTVSEICKHLKDVESSQIKFIQKTCEIKPIEKGK